MAGKLIEERWMAEGARRVLLALEKLYLCNPKIPAGRKRTAALLRALAYDRDALDGVIASGRLEAWMTAGGEWLFKKG